MASPLRILVIVVAATALLGAGTYVWLSQSAAPAGKAAPRVVAPSLLEKVMRPADTSRVFAAGDSWRITAWHNAGAASPDASPVWYQSDYFFAIKGAPPKGSPWLVHVTSPQAQGTESPFAAGADLYYRHNAARDTFTLERVGLTGGEPVEAEFAPLVLGEDFPLEATITAKPPTLRDTVLAGRGMGGSVTPTMAP